MRKSFKFYMLIIVLVFIAIGITNTIIVSDKNSTSVVRYTVITDRNVQYKTTSIFFINSNCIKFNVEHINDPMYVCGNFTVQIDDKGKK